MSESDCKTLLSQRDVDIHRTGLDHAVAKPLDFHHKDAFGTADQQEVPGLSQALHGLPDKPSIDSKHIADALDGDVKEVVPMDKS